MRILITGAAGAVGSTLVKGMKDRYSLRGLDVVPMPELDDAVIGNVSDFESALSATKDVEVVIHLANQGPDWESLLSNSYVGTYNVFEAARQNGVRRIVYASRAGLLGPYPKDIQRTVDLLPRPESLYSISKVFGESLGWMYSARHGMEFVAVRIGNFNRDRDLPSHPHQLSHGDAVRVFERAAIQPDVKFEIVFGVSVSNWPMYDLDHGRKAIGYDPQDFADVPENERG